MTSRWRLGALLVALALTGACSGGGDGDSSKKSATLQTEDSDTTLRVGSDETTTTEAGGGAGGSTTTGKPGATTTAKRGAPATTGGAPAPTAPAAAGEPAPGPAKTGTYTYSQSGSTPDGPVPPSGTLVVSGGQTQSFARYYDQAKQPQRLTYAFRDDGAYITAATISFNGATANCSFGNGVPVPPWPATAGRSYSGSGSCSTPAGQLTASISGSVTSRNGDIVGLSTTIKAYNASRSIDVTLKDVESWSVSLRVPKTSRQTFSGSAFGSPISGDVSSTLTGTP